MLASETARGINVTDNFLVDDLNKYAKQVNNFKKHSWSSDFQLTWE